MLSQIFLCILTLVFVRITLLLLWDMCLFPYSLSSIIDQGQRSTKLNLCSQYLLLPKIICFFSQINTTLFFKSTKVFLRKKQILNGIIYYMAYKDKYELKSFSTQDSVNIPLCTTSNSHLFTKLIFKLYLRI